MAKDIDIYPRYWEQLMSFVQNESFLNSIVRRESLPH